MEGNLNVISLKQNIFTNLSLVQLMFEHCYYKFLVYSPFYSVTRVSFLCNNPCCRQALQTFVCLMQDGGIRIHGRKLMIVAAVSREDAVKLKVDKKKVETGTRNLYLAREGCE